MKSRRLGLSGGIALLIGACLSSAQLPVSHEKKNRETRSRQPSALEQPAEVGIERESYSYDRAGRRDPFLSLLETEKLHPLSRDLRLVAIAFDPAGQNSIAILRDLSTGAQHRVKHGDAVGRMSVVAIRDKSVAFAVESSGRHITHSLAFSARATTMP